MFLIILFGFTRTVAVAVAFFLCWAPFHSQRLMAVYGKTSRPQSDIFRNTYTALTYISGVLYFMSTCINPLLYSIMSHKFRNAFKVINLFYAIKKNINSKNISSISGVRVLAENFHWGFWWKKLYLLAYIPYNTDIECWYFWYTNKIFAYLHAWTISGRFINTIMYSQNLYSAFVWLCLFK